MRLDDEFSSRGLDPKRPANASHFAGKGHLALPRTDVLDRAVREHDVERLIRKRQITRVADDVGMAARARRRTHVEDRDRTRRNVAVGPERFVAANVKDASRWSRRQHLQKPQHPTAAEGWGTDRVDAVDGIAHARWPLLPSERRKAS